MSEENQSPERPAAPAPEAATENAAEAPTVRTPVEGEVPPGAVPPPGAVGPGAVPPGSVPPPGGGYYYPPGMPMPRQPNGFGRFVRHRATQIVAAAVLGLIVGGGTIALVDDASGFGPGHSFGHHMQGGYGGGGYGFHSGGQGGGQGGPGFGQQTPNGN
jgi:hypothetical protein